MDVQFSDNAAKEEINKNEEKKDIVYSKYQKPLKRDHFHLNNKQKKKINK